MIKILVNLNIYDRDDLQMNGSVTKKNLYLFLVSFNYRYVHFEYTLIIQNKLLKLSQLERMIRGVY